MVSTPSRAQRLVASALGETGQGRPYRAGRRSHPAHRSSRYGGLYSRASRQRVRRVPKPASRRSRSRDSRVPERGRKFLCRLLTAIQCRFPRDKSRTLQHRCRSQGLRRNRQRVQWGLALRMVQRRSLRRMTYCGNGARQASRSRRTARSPPAESRNKHAMQKLTNALATFHSLAVNTPPCSRARPPISIYRRVARETFAKQQSLPKRKP